MVEREHFTLKKEGESQVLSLNPAGCFTAFDFYLGWGSNAVQALLAALVKTLLS